MPPSARKYGLVAYSERPLVKMSTSSSVGLTDLISAMDVSDSDLLSEPFALPESPSSLSDTLEVISPFPVRRRRSLVKFVSLRTDLLLSPPGASSTRGSSEWDEWGKVMIAAPTPPRLRAMLREVVNVRKWRVCGPFSSRVAFD